MFAGLVSAYLGELLAALAGPFLFSAFPDSNRAENTKLISGSLVVSGIRC